MDLANQELAHSEYLRQVESGPMRSWLADWLAKKTLPQTLLFLGAEGANPKPVSERFTQWIFCERRPFIQSQRERADEESGQNSLFGGSGVIDSEPEMKLDHYQDLHDDLLGPDHFMDHDDHEDQAPDAPPVIARLDHYSLSDYLPCEKCPSCLAFKEKNTPAVWEIESETGTLKIESFRELKERIGFAAEPGSFFVIRIHGLEGMTPASANSVLKILEEPPSGWIFVMTATDQSRVLPTLLSRCLRIRMKPALARQTQFLVEEEFERFERFLVAPDSTFADWIDYVASSADRLDRAISQAVHRAAENRNVGYALALEKKRSRVRTPVNLKLLAQSLFAPMLLPENRR